MKSLKIFLLVVFGALVLLSAEINHAYVSQAWSQGTDVDSRETPVSGWYALETFSTEKIGLVFFIH